MCMFTVTPARANEWPAAFQLIFQHLPSSERQARVANGLRLASAGNLDPQGIFVIRDDRRLAGAVVGVPLAGAGGLVWPPGVHPDPQQSAWEDQLVSSAVSWLRTRGIKIAQALLPPAEADRAAPLLRQGFRHVTRLQYLHHPLKNLPPAVDGSDCRFENYDPTLRAALQQTLLRTYEGTLDCPELNGARTIDEIIAGHQAQGEYDPARWWLAWSGAEPVGVLLLCKLFDSRAWDLSYVGVVPAARRRGLARALTQLALRQARGGGASQLNVAVDVRNQPARKLYASLGFSPGHEREVYLALLAAD